LVANNDENQEVDTVFLELFRAFAFALILYLLSSNSYSRCRCPNMNIRNRMEKMRIGICCR
jgi:hypothetical protein